MKKVLLFLVLLLIPFIVQAETEYGLLFESERVLYCQSELYLNPTALRASIFILLKHIHLMMVI